mmetsp:Transcript_11558/g.49281  ORF Transcript_11558/g.49281 Transcript_11558/m.49281 type:complete len:293 (-) Transcript_11558:315-1193(-)
MEAPRACALPLAFVLVKRHGVARETRRVERAPPPAPVLFLVLGVFPAPQRVFPRAHALGADGRGDHRQTVHPRVHDLALDAGAEPQRREQNPRLLHRRLHGRREPQHVKPLLRPVQLLHGFRGVRAVDAHGGVRQRLADPRPHLCGEPPHGVDVGRVVKRADGGEPLARRERRDARRRKVVFARRFVFRLAEERRRDELRRGNPEAVAHQPRLHRRAHQRQVASVHGRELARDARVARGGHRGKRGAQNGFGFVGAVFFFARVSPRRAWRAAARANPACPVCARRLAARLVP